MQNLACERLSLGAFVAALLALGLAFAPTSVAEEGAPAGLPVLPDLPPLPTIPPLFPGPMPGVPGLPNEPDPEDLADDAADAVGRSTRLFDVRQTIRVKYHEPDPDNILDYVLGEGPQPVADASASWLDPLVHGGPPASPPAVADSEGGTALGSLPWPDRPSPDAAAGAAGKEAPRGLPASDLLALAPQPDARRPAPAEPPKPLSATPDPRPIAAAGGAMAAFALVVGGISLILRVVGISPLLTRIPRDQVRDHPLRARILEEVRAHPGIHLNSLGRRLGLSNSQRSHHVRALVEAGLLVEHGTPGYLCLFTAGHAGLLMARLAPLLRKPRAWRVLGHVTSHPGQGVGELREALRVPAGTLHYHLERLTGAGLLRSENGDRPRSFWPTEEGRRVLETLGGFGPGDASGDVNA